MKAILYFWTLITNFFFPNPSDTFTPRQVINIDSIVRSIDAGKSFRHVVRSAEGFSTEGTELTGTYDRNKQLRKLKAIHFGEMGKVSREYYLYKDALIYQKTITYTYDKPFYVEGYKVTVKRTQHNCIAAPAKCNDADFREERDAFIQDDEVYTFVEKMPEFPGGEMALFEFMWQEVIITEQDTGEVIQTKFNIEFVINSEGQVISPSINKKRRADLTKLESAVLRMVYKMPRWKPGEQAGKKVSVKLHYPLILELRE